jgi:hypothetical protein
MTAKAMKIRELRVPAADQPFDPARYLAGLEFYESAVPLTETDRSGLANIVHYLAFLSLRHGDDQYNAAVIPRASSAYAALESCYQHLEGWSELPLDAEGLAYRDLVPFLLHYYPPPERPSTGISGLLKRWWKS